MYSTKHKISTWKLLLALIFSGIAASSMAQDINISVSDTAAIAGETILVPLRISPIDETDAVISGTFKFSTNESIFEIVGFDKAGTLLENTSNVFYNVGTNTLAFAGTDTLVGSGTLINLRVKAKDNATYFQYTDLSFDDATLNEGEPAVNATGARWTIKGIQINPRSSSTFVLEGDSLQFNLTGNIVDPVSWSVTDTTIGTIDSNGLFAAKTFGLVQVKAVDGQGLRDSTAFFRVQPSTLTELSVTIPDTSIRQTKDISLPIYISDVTGLEVLSADLQVNYNQNYLTLNGVTSAGTMTESWGEPTINTETGSVKIASAGTDTLEGFGTLYYLNFTVKDINTGSFPINFVYANLNEDLSIDLNNGTFTVLAKPTINLNIPDTLISIGQSIDFDVSGGNGTGPYTWQVNDSNIATIDANTGVLTALSRGDVLVNAVDNEGFLSSSVNVRVNDFDAYLDSSTATYPDTIEVALRTGELSPFNVLSYQAEVEYDTSKLEFLGLKTEGTQSENASAEATVDVSLKIASAGTSFLGGTDPIVILKFAQKDAIEHLDELILDLKYLTFDEPGPDVPTTSPLPGILNIIKIDPPEAPELVSPADLGVNLDTALVFDWNSSVSADEYTFQLSEDSTFNSLVENTTLSTTQFLVDSLDYLTKYFWRVKASNLGGESAWSDTLSFTTIIEKPEIPVLLAPVDGVTKTDTTVSLSWNSALRADAYVLQISRFSDFSSLDYSTPVFDTTYSQDNLQFLTDYYWRVRAVNDGGESDFSPARTFQTKAVPASVPMLISPADQTVDTDTSLTLIWTSAEGAISYEYQLATDAEFSSLISGSNTGTDTSATIADLSYLTEYFWRVRAIGAQDTSDYSEPFSFTTKIALPEQPMLLSPADGVTAQPLSLDLVWATASRASEYQVEVSESSDFSVLISDQTTSDTTFTATGLENLTDYFWRVKSINTTGESAYSEIRTFQTKAVDASVPVLINPVSGSTDVDTSLTLTWSTAEGALNYEYQVSEAVDFASLIHTASGPDTTALISGLSFSTQYFWRARAIGAQDTSDWSSIFDFTTIIEKPEVPALVSPIDDFTDADTTLSLVWNSSERAAEYQVELSKSDSFTEILIASVVSDTSLVISNLDFSSTYFWKVKALNAGGESMFSQTRSFQTKVAPTGLPVPLLPAMSENGVDTMPTFLWTQAENALSYRFQLSSDVDFSSVLDDQKGLVDTTTTSFGLSFGTEYFWRVKAFGVNDSTEWSLVFNFTTRFDELAAPILLSPAKNAVDLEDSVSFEWTAVAEADSYDFELNSDTTQTALVNINQADTMYTHTSLAFDSTYYWRVKANDGITGRTSVWTPWFAFTVKSQPDADPTVVNPLGAITLFEDFADTTIADLSTVFDDPGDVLSFSITQTSDLVNTSIDGSNLIFSSVQDTSGSAEIIVEASDVAGNTVSDTLSVTVTPVNDLPYVVELPDTLTFKVGEVFNFTIDTAFADVEDKLGELSFTVSVNPTDILLGFDPNTYSITLNSPSYVGFGEIRLTVEDSEGGQLEVVLVIEVEIATSNALMADIPTNFELQQNYPNPFNPSSNIRFGLPESGEVRLDVYNMLGQRVATLVNQKMQAGWHSVTFDASGLSSGTYIYRITSGDFVQTKKMMLIK